MQEVLGKNNLYRKNLLKLTIYIYPTWVYNMFIIWVRMGSGGSRGLQIHCWVVVPAMVGSIPTRARHFTNLFFSYIGGGSMTDKEIIRLTHMSSKAG